MSGEQDGGGVCVEVFLLPADVDGVAGVAGLVWLSAVLLYNSRMPFSLASNVRLLLRSVLANTPLTCGVTQPFRVLYFALKPVAFLGMAGPGILGFKHRIR